MTAPIFTNNTFTILSFPELTTIYYLDMDSNPYLSSIDFPKVVEIGAMNSTNNSRLETLNLPKLGYVDYYLNISGPFSRYAELVVFFHMDH